MVFIEDKIKIVVVANTLLLICLFFGCDTEDTANDENNTGATTPVTEAHLFEETLLQTENLLQEVNLLTDVAMTDGSTADCYQLIFKGNPVANGPYCPTTIDAIGGLGFYDGTTNAGFQVMQRALWEAMEADGYDIVDEDGNISIVDPGGALGAPAGSSCLEATPDDDLRMVFLIPAHPTNATSNDEISTVEHIGVSRQGIPITGHPPSATAGRPGMSSATSFAGIPALDPCGGHMDPAGYYHLHFGPEAMNLVLEAQGVTEFSCENFNQSETGFIGYAKDGYPIYSATDEAGIVLDDLDECLGHIGMTDDFEEEVYHYHISSTEAPNLPTCLKGISPQNPFSYE